MGLHAATSLDPPHPPVCHHCFTLAGKACFSHPDAVTVSYCWACRKFLCRDHNMFHQKHWASREHETTGLGPLPTKVLDAFRIVDPRIFPDSFSNRESTSETDAGHNLTPEGGHESPSIDVSFAARGMFSEADGIDDLSVEAKGSSAVTSIATSSQSVPVLMDEAGGGREFCTQHLASRVPAATEAPYHAPAAGVGVGGVIPISGEEATASAETDTLSLGEQRGATAAKFSDMEEDTREVSKYGVPDKKKKKKRARKARKNGAAEPPMKDASQNVGSSGHTRGGGSASSEVASCDAERLESKIVNSTLPVASLLDRAGPKSKAMNHDSAKHAPTSTVSTITRDGTDTSGSGPPHAAADADDDDAGAG
eukprot:Rmarinus@m.4752